MAEDKTGGGEGGGKDKPLPFKFTNTAADDKTSGLRTPLRVEEVRVQESLRAWGHKPGTKGRLSNVIRSAATHPAAMHETPRPSVRDRDRQGAVSSDISGRSRERRRDSMAS